MSESLGHHADPVPIGTICLKLTYRLDELLFSPGRIRN